VITAKEIRDSGASSLGELLATIPGLDVARFAAADYAVSARGFNDSASSHMLVMVDGRTAYDDFFGLVPWDWINVTLQDIERIEIIRGPGSALYGANAFLGIINIITKDARDLPRLYTRTGFGSHGPLVSATAATSTDNTTIKASARYKQLDHFRNETNTVSNAAHRRDETAVRNQLFNATVTHEFSDGTELTISSGMSRIRNTLLAAGALFDYEGPRWYGKANLTRGPWKAQAFFNRIDMGMTTMPPANIPNGVELRERFVSNLADLEIQREFGVKNHDLIFGFSTRRITTTAPVFMGSRESETFYGLFAQDEYRISDRLTGFLGLRFDDHPRTSVNISPRGGLVFKLSETSRIRASIARSFRNPGQLNSDVSLTYQGDLGFGPIPLNTTVGDEDLDPMWVTAYEAGFQIMPHPQVNLGADVFFHVIEDFFDIVTTSLGPPAINRYVNAGRTKSYGGEFSLEYRPFEWLRGFGTYSYQTANGPFEGSTPRHKASAGIRGTMGSRLRYALTGFFVSHHEFESPTAANAVFPSRTVQSRFSIDGFVGVQVRPNVELGFKARNLFNQVRRQYPLGDEIGSELLATVTFEF
jgi:iron complex outermembrane receptor protein